MSHHYIEFKDVSFSYPHSQEVLHNISFRIDHGEHVALLGLNGSGKSTLMMLVNGLLIPSKGEILIGDIPVVKKTLPLVRQTVGFVFQNSDDMLFMPTIGEDVAFGPRNMGLPDNEVNRRVKVALKDVGLEGMEDRTAFTLSGGQRKAASIAAVLSMEPSILVLDEPSSGLDALAREQLIEILNQFSHTILLATHDMDLAYRICHRALTLSEGNLIEDCEIESANHKLDIIASSRIHSLKNNMN